MTNTSPSGYFSSPKACTDEFVSGLHGEVTFTGILEKYLHTKELIASHIKQLEENNKVQDEQIQEISETLKKLKDEEIELRKKLDEGLKQLETQVKSNTETIKFIQSKLNLTSSSDDISTEGGMPETRATSQQQDTEQEATTDKEDILSRLARIEKQVETNTKVLHSDTAGDTNQKLTQLNERIEQAITTVDTLQTTTSNNFTNDRDSIAKLEQKLKEQSDHHHEIIKNLYKEITSLHEECNFLSSRITEIEASQQNTSTQTTGASNTTGGIIRRLSKKRHNSTANSTKRHSLPEGSASFDDENLVIIEVQNNSSSLEESREEVPLGLHERQDIEDSGYNMSFNEADTLTRSRRSSSEQHSSLIKTPLSGAKNIPKDSSTPR